jgi:hypothetical protein
LWPLAHPLKKPAAHAAKNATPPKKAFNFRALIESPKPAIEKKVKDT